MSNSDLSDLRREYALAGLDEADLADCPFTQFGRWFDAINRPDTLDANAMILATVDEHSRPSQRTVLLKRFDTDGFVFFTDYRSRKGREIASNSQVSLIFSWHVLERQVIIQGVADKIDAADSDDYFASRPLGSQIAASVSSQSQTIDNRTTLEKRYKELERQLGESPPDRPKHWGGFCVVPYRIEFWQGRKNRLHDRLLYSRKDLDSCWTISRLQP